MNAAHHAPDSSASGAVRALIERAGGFAYARRRAQELADEARGLLNGERQGPARRALDHAIDYAVNRDH
mgnify:CR=1 FL=1